MVPCVGGFHNAQLSGVEEHKKTPLVVGPTMMHDNYLMMLDGKIWISINFREVA